MVNVLEIYFLHCFVHVFSEDFYNNTVSDPKLIYLPAPRVYETTKGYEQRASLSAKGVSSQYAPGCGDAVSSLWT